ncbi:DUF1778 domain-containing protein [Bordetella hinzii]|uniref:type II toxin -antitoxin system TacA 1-like antitoxin n=1 Tax=Bordetella hinzii TaxID=103855 RepID=UPI0039FD5C1B
MNGNERMDLRVSSDIETMCMHEAEVVRLPARDYAQVLELLKNPPKPNTKLRSAMARYLSYCEAAEL